MNMNSSSGDIRSRQRLANSSTDGALFSTSGFFLLRTPLLPFDDFLAWGQGLRAGKVFENSRDPGAREAAWLDDVEVLRSRLRQISNRPEIRQALFIASPSLESSISGWGLTPDSKRGLQTERSLSRYFSRMTGRSTPFGLFAGYSIGVISKAGETDDRVALSLQSRDHYKLSSRLDNDFLFALTASLQRMPEIAAELRYLPNSSLHQVGSDWHYVKTAYAGPQRSHHSVKLSDQPYLPSLVNCAKAGATVSQLVETLVLQPADPPLSQDEAVEYVQALIDEQVLISTLAPLVTIAEGSPLDDLIGQLDRARLGSGVSSVLRETKNALARVDQNGLGTPRSVYEDISLRLASLPLEVDISRLFQVDMKKPMASGILSSSVIVEITRTLELLLTSEALSPPEPSKVRRFREAFVTRYGQRWVPLLTALDEDVGLGFDSADDASVTGGRDRAEGNPRSDVRSTFDSFYSLLLRKTIDCAREGTHELLLDHADIGAGNSSEPRGGDSFSVMFTLVADSVEDIQNGNFQIYLRASKGVTGAALLGRFCQADKELHEHVRQHLRDEEVSEQNVVYAEIVHLPEGRLGNIVCRPIFRDFEIPYLGRSGISEDRQLPASDLLITVTNGQVILFSRRLAKRVIPRLTAAHSFDTPGFPPVYRFLGYLQYLPRSEIRLFDWGPLAELPFLPRVRLGRTILSPARWRITSEDVNTLIKNTRCATFFAVQELRQQRRLPRFLLLEDRDNVLPIDLDNALSLDAFVHLMRRRGAGTLLEMYRAPGGLCASGPEGQFHHEIVLPLIRRRNGSKQDESASGPNYARLASNLRCTSERRSFPPGSEWLFVKLYGGTTTLDRLLINEVRHLVRAAASASLMSSWFFIRYADPDPHLRIRFRGDQERLTQELLPLIASVFNPLVDQTLWKIEHSTYVPELERYGGPQGIAEAEHIFFRDSEAVLSILESLKGDYDLDTRIRIAIMGADRLLRDCKLGLSERLALAKRARDAFARELQLNPTQLRSLGEQFRIQRKTVEALVDDTSHPPHSVVPEEVWTALGTRSVALAGSVQRLLALQRTEPASLRLTNFAASCVHMHINRLMRSHARRQEAVVYDFLSRVYSTMAAKSDVRGDSLRK